MESFGVILPAGGSSTRMGSERSKLLLPLEGESVIERSLAPFLSVSGISSIVVPVPESQLSDFKLALRRLCEESGKLHLIVGGRSRQESVWKALNYFKTDLMIPANMKILVHDAARCFVTGALVQDVLSALNRVSAVSPGIACTDSIKEVEEASGEVCRSLERKRLRQVQTPQGFRFESLYSAHESALRASDHTAQYEDAVQCGIPEATDDASLVERHGVVHMIEGDVINIKITTPQDYEYARFLLRSA